MASSLTFLHDLDDLRAVEALHPEALRGAVVAADLDIHLELLDRGAAHATPWDYIDPAERADLERLDGALQDFWRRHACAEFDGIDLLGLARYRHVTCLRRAAWWAHSTGRAIEHFQPGEVVTFRETSGHGLEQPAAAARPPLLFTILGAQAEARGVPVRELDRGAVPGVEGFVDHASRAARAPSLAPIGPGRLRDPWILFYGNGADLERQAPLVRSLLERGGLTVVQAYAAASAENLAAAGAAGHLLCHQSQLAAPVQPAGLDRVAAPARSALDRAIASAAPEVRAAFAGLGLHLDFIYGRYLEAMAGHVATWRGFFTEHRPALVISTSPVPMADIAAACGVEVLHLAHAVTMLDFPEIYAAMPGGIVGAVSPAHARRLHEAGVPASRVRLTGDPGHEATPRGPARGRGRPREAGRSARVLLLTNTMAMHSTAGTLPAADWRRQHETAEAIGDLAAAHPEWAFRLRRHPRYDHPRLYDRINARLPAGRRIEVIDPDRTSLAEAVSEADVVVCPDAVGSALIEASDLGRPVVILDTALHWFDHRRWRTERWPRAGSVGELGRILAGLLADPAAWRETAAQTRSALEHHLGEPSLPGTARCIDVIEEICRDGRRVADLVR